jgi:hypothetical protein
VTRNPVWRSTSQRVSALGLSRVGHYGPMAGFHHRVKTHGGWEVLVA